MIAKGTWIAYNVRWGRLKPCVIVQMNKSFRAKELIEDWVGGAQCDLKSTDGKVSAQ